MKHKIIISGLVLSLIIITLLIILFVQNIEIGYVYYTQDNILSIELSDNLQQKIESITQAFKDKGFSVVDNSFSNISCKKILMERENIVKEKSALDAFLEKEIGLTVSLTKLQISKEDLIYYFKSEEECNDFIKAINISEYNIENYIGDYQLVTDKEVLDNKIIEYENQKKIAQQRTQRALVASRGGNREDICPPMETYVYISSYYGMRNGKMHTGVDFAAPAGTSIYAWKDGIVTFAGWSGGYGNFVTIQHEDGYVSRYAHCSELLVEEGQVVKKDETIAYVGSTGNSTGYHLHFEILIDDEFINPLTPITI